MVSEKSNGLWYLKHDSYQLSANNQHLPQAMRPQAPCPYVVNTMTANILKNIYQLSWLKDDMQYIHAVLFSPAKQTLIKAVKSGSLLHGHC